VRILNASGCLDAIAAPEVAPDDVVPEAFAPEAVEPEPVAAEPGIEGTPVMAPPSNGSGTTTIGAAIDVGANSVHLLVAAAGGHHLEPLLDESVFLGLGDRVARDGRIGSEARAEVVRALAQYVDTAHRMAAGDVTLVDEGHVATIMIGGRGSRECYRRSGGARRQPEAQR